MRKRVSSDEKEEGLLLRLSMRSHPKYSVESER